MKKQGLKCLLKPFKVSLLKLKSGKREEISIWFKYFKRPHIKYCFFLYRLRIGRVTSNNKELVGDHPLVLLVAVEAGVGLQASSRKDQRVEAVAVDGVVAEV
jgi:hypothetical protein